MSKQSVCLCKPADFLQLREKCPKKKSPKKKKKKKRRTEEAHNVLYQIPLASKATAFALNSYSIAMKALKC